VSLLTRLGGASFKSKNSKRKEVNFRKEVNPHIVMHILTPKKRRKK